MTLFNEVTTPEVEVESALVELVGEGKKFKDPESLARGKMESDLHIAEQARRLQELEQELARRKTAEEILEQIKTGKQTGEEQTPPTQNQQVATPDIQKIVSEHLAREKSLETKTRNGQAVSDRLVKEFGSEVEANKEINKKARELNLSVQDLQEQALRSPTAFYRLMGLDNPRQAAPAAPTGRGHVSLPPSSGQRDKAYWDRVKASDPQKWRDSLVERYRDQKAILDAGGSW